MDFNALLTREREGVSIPCEKSTKSVLFPKNVRAI